LFLIASSSGALEPGLALKNTMRAIDGPSANATPLTATSESVRMATLKGLLFMA
jgi:hypothetical protein